MEQYADACADINNLPRCYIRIDVAHFLRKYSRYLTASGVRPLSKTFLMGTVGALIMCKKLGDAEEIVRHLLLITSSETIGDGTPSLNAAYAALKLKLTDDSPDQKEITRLIEKIDDEGSSEDFNEDEVEEIGNYWRNWGERIREDVGEIIMLEQGEDDNPRAVKNFSKYLLKDICILPMWSNVRRDEFGYGRVPASSACVEIEFNKVKNLVLSKKKRIDSAVESLIDYYDGRLRIISSNDTENPNLSLVDEGPVSPMASRTARSPSPEIEVIEDWFTHHEENDIEEDTSDNTKHLKSSPNNMPTIKTPSIEDLPLIMPLDYSLKKNTNDDCIACRSQDQPSGAHECCLCLSYVHTLPGCSVSIGDTEGYGERRICMACARSSPCEERIAAKYFENWRGRGQHTKKKTITLVHPEETTDNTESPERKRKALYLGASKEKLKEALTFQKRSTIPILRNGNCDKLSYIKFPGQAFISIKNTCAFDSLYQIILAAATDYDAIKTFIQNRKSDSPFFELVNDTLQNGVRAHTYRLRATMLLKFKKEEPLPNTSKCIDCTDNIGTLASFLFSKVPSFLEIFRCQQGCSDRFISLPTYGLRKNQLTDADFKTVVLDYVRRKRSPQCVKQGCVAKEEQISLEISKYNSLLVSKSRLHRICCGKK